MSSTPRPLRARFEPKYVHFSGCPAYSIVEDQIDELTELGFTAVHLKENDPDCMKDIAGGNIDFIFCCDNNGVTGLTDSHPCVTAAWEVLLELVYL